MSIPGALARFQARQAAQFTQRATIQRRVGEPTFTPEDGYRQEVTTIAADVPCKVTSNERQGQDVQAGQTEARIVDHEVKFPVGTLVEKDDLVTVTASVHNPQDTDRTYRVTDIDRREWQISRRCIIEEVLVPTLYEEES